MIKKIKNIFSTFFKSFSTASFIFLLVLPASTNYKLKDYGFGSGGTSDTSSGSYSMESIVGDVGKGKLSSAAYGIGSGLIFNGQANVPLAPTFTNPSSYYNKLQIILNTSGNPTDTKYAIAISSDDFVTTKYVQSDNTIGTTLGAEDYQTYTSWGGASGVYVIGLAAGTTYKVKVKAIQGKFSETGYGPTSSAATVDPILTFDVDVSVTDSETNPPFSINFGDLSVNTIIDSPQKVWIDFSTNGETGGKVYVSGKNGGLASISRSFLISSVSGDLTSLSQGVGAQGSMATQISGGPLLISTAYNQIGNVVASIDTTAKEVFSSAAPVVGGRGSFMLKAKSSSVTPSANDYSETFSVVASGSF